MGNYLSLDINVVPMAGQSCGDLASDGITQQIGVPDNVQDLVTGEFVGKTEFGIEDIVLADKDEIVQASS